MELTKQLAELTGEQLHEKVWSVPVSELSGEFGLSDVAIAKRCRKLGAPCPPRGYWAKVQAGKKPRQSGEENRAAAAGRFAQSRGVVAAPPGRAGFCRRLRKAVDDFAVRLPRARAGQLDQMGEGDRDGNSPFSFWLPRSCRGWSIYSQFRSIRRSLSDGAGVLPSAHDAENAQDDSG